MAVSQKHNVNIREIAKIAGVSVASVSRALQDQPSKKVSAALREKILKICDDLQYSPNMHTVRMFANRANTVALIYPSYEFMHDALDKGRMDFNLGACITGAEEYLASRSIYLTLTSTTKKFLKNKEYLKIFRSKMVDGVLIWGWTQKDEFLYELLEENVPTVMLQTEAVDAKVGKVVADDYQGMKAMVEYVVSKGHRQIAIATPSKFSSAGQQRLKGLLDTLAEFGLTPCYITERHGFGPEFGYLAGKEILAKNTGATCIIAPNDTSAMGIIQVAREAGLRVPDDISVTGADGVKFLGQTQLTTYISPSFDIGQKGAELLLRKIEAPKATPERVCFPVSFIEGETLAKLKQ